MKTDGEVPQMTHLYVHLCDYCVSSFSAPYFFRTRAEYGEIVRISPYSVEMRENTDQKNSEYGHFSRSVCFNLCFCSLLNTGLYCNNIESHTEKHSKYCLVCEAVLIDRAFGNIFRQYFG